MLKEIRAALRDAAGCLLLSQDSARRRGLILGYSRPFLRSGGTERWAPFSLPSVDRGPVNIQGFEAVPFQSGFKLTDYSLFRSLDKIGHLVYFAM